MKRRSTGPIAQLILDLEARGLLDRTLVVVASEFSRDMMIEGVPGSNGQRPVAGQDRRDEGDDPLRPAPPLHRLRLGRCMFGGGMKRGLLYGETAPERPLLTTKDPVTIRDLHATIFTAMGISPTTAFDIEKRPFYATEDGKGQPVQALFAQG